MNTRDLMAVQALVLAGTTKGAAVNIGVSQPTVSRAVVEMEAYFGRQLFARQHGRLVPTAAALRISRGAAEISTILQGLQKDLDTAASEQTLCIGLSPDHNSALIHQAIRRLGVMQPNTAVRLYLMNETELSQALVDSRIDLALSGQPHPAAEIEVEHMMSPSLCCLLPVKHRLQNEAVLTPELLAGEPIVGVRMEESPTRHVRAAFREAGVAFKEGLDVSSISLACEFVALGMGVAFCAPFDLAAKQSAIVVRPFSPAIECRLFSMMQATGPMYQTARQFCRLVRLTNQAGQADLGRSLAGEAR